MSPRETEKIKLSATYLNGIAIAVFAVGGFAPLFSGRLPRPDDAEFGVILAVTAGCWAVSVGRHSIARNTLEGLPDDEPPDL